MTHIMFHLNQASGQFEILILDQFEILFPQYNTAFKLYGLIQIFDVKCTHNREYPRFRLTAIFAECSCSFRILRYSIHFSIYDIGQQCFLDIILGVTLQLKGLLNTIAENPHCCCVTTFLLFYNTLTNIRNHCLQTPPPFVKGIHKSNFKRQCR